MSASVLFDAPGPKARLRHRIMTGVGAFALIVVAYLVAKKLHRSGQVSWDRWRPFFRSDTWTEYLLPGVQGTLTAAFLSIVFALVFGAVFGVGRLSRFSPIRWICGVIVELFRAVPVLLMMVFLYFGYFTDATIFSSDFIGSYAPLAAVVVALTLYNGSVIAELVRSGVYSLPKGQSEAGASVGLTDGQVLRLIQLPQALTAMLPALIGQLVVILKDTALGYQVLFLELLTSSKTLGSARGNTVAAYIVAAVLFIVLNYSLTKFAEYIEKRLKRGRGFGRSGSATANVIGPEGEPGAPASAGARMISHQAEKAHHVVDRGRNQGND